MAGVLIVLPPSEGKTSPPASCSPGQPNLLAHDQQLGHTRRLVADALMEVCRQDNAAQILGVGAAVARELGHNLQLASAPAAPAAQVYTGVLYAAAQLHLAAPEASSRVRIFSALWGALSPLDRIPAYRLSMGVDLPGIGKLAAAWRAPLAQALQPLATDDVVVDCRSAAYVAAWKPDTSQGDWASIKVLREQNGKRTVVSHHAKHTRGLVTRHLLTRQGTPPSTAHSLLEAVGELVGTATANPANKPKQANQPHTTGSASTYRLLDVALHQPTSTRPSGASGPHTLEVVVG